MKFLRCGIVHIIIYEDDLTFRDENPSGKRKEQILEKRIIFEESKCNRYDILTEKRLGIYKELPINLM